MMGAYVDLCACVCCVCVYAHVGTSAHSVELNMCHCAKLELMEATGPRLKPKACF